MKIRLFAAVAAMALATAGAPASAIEATVGSVAADPVLLYSGPQGKPTGRLPAVQFPTKVDYIETSPGGRHHVRLPTGEDVWVLGRHVILNEVDRRNVSCDGSIAAQPGSVTRALGGTCK